MPTLVGHGSREIVAPFLEENTCSLWQFVAGGQEVSGRFSRRFEGWGQGLRTFRVDSFGNLLLVETMSRRQNSEIDAKLSPRNPCVGKCGSCSWLWLCSLLVLLC